MSKFTTEVRFICEQSSGLDLSKGFDDVNDILVKSAPKVFNFDFPIFDESYRLSLEVKILRHFYTREIGFETVGLWKLHLQNTLCEIMPYYNQLYKSELLEFNPLYDVDLTTDHNKKVDDENNTETNSKTQAQTDSTEKTTNKSDASSSTTSREYFSDTPQDSVNIPFTKSGGSVNLNANSTGYISNASLNLGEGTTHQEDVGTGQSTDKTNANTDNKGRYKGTSLEDYVEHVKGKRGTTSYSNLLSEFRSTFLNIDAMIIEELETLFFGLWD